MRRLLILTIPATVVVAWAAVRSVRETGNRVGSDVVATFRVDSLVMLDLPAAGTYRAIGIGSREAIQRAGTWDVTIREAGGGAPGEVLRPSTPRARERENRPGLDLLFSLRVGAAGRHELRIQPPGPVEERVTLRLSHVNTATAGTAMKAFGLATLFSVLLLASAMLWFRR